MATPTEDRGSVSRLIDALKASDEDAASRLWKRYFGKLTAMARRRLEGVPGRLADEEDIALSVFHCLCRGAADGRFARLEDRDDLWQILVTVTARKAVDQHRRLYSQKRGGDAVWIESEMADVDSALAALDQLSDDQPTPDMLVELMEEYDRLLQQLGDDTLRRIVLLKIEGLTNRDVASQLNITPRSVQRKLQRIQRQWRKELDQ